MSRRRDNSVDAQGSPARAGAGGPLRSGALGRQPHAEDHEGGTGRGVQGPAYV